jgi:thiol-disulfide isomerase/thioredoxin
VGTRLQEIALEQLTGDARPITTADLGGKVTLINFWGPWCGPCAIEFPHLIELQEHFRGHSDFQFLSVSSNPDPRDDRGLAESTREFLRQQRAAIPTYRDPAGRTTIALIHTARLESFGYPTTVLLDREGVIRALWTGYRPGDERSMRAAIDEILRGARLGTFSSEAKLSVRSESKPTPRQKPPHDANGATFQLQA